ncbi:MAG: hypothetical protein NC133_04745 [Prevotella sp.]|nr:hypothetical protein [Prevotella sp.]
MKKVFNAIYNTYRKHILYTLFVLYVFLFACTLSTVTNFSWFSIVKSAISCLIAVILVFYLIADIINRKFYITWYLLIGTICAVPVVFTAQSVMLCFFLAFAYAFKDCDFKELTFLSAMSLFGSLTLIVLLSSFGVIDDLIIMRGEIVRRTLGFTAATSVSQLFMLGVLAYNYYRQTDISYGELAFELVAISCIYGICNTRLSFVLTILIILWSLLVKLRKNKVHHLENFLNKYNKLFSILFAILPVLAVLGFGLLVFLYQYDLAFINQLDSWLSARIRCTYHAFHESPLRFFGAKQNWLNAKGEYIGVDSGFYQYLFIFGIAPTIFIMFTMIYLYYKSVRSKNYYLCFCLFILVIDFALGNSFVDIRQNIFLLAIMVLGNDMLYGEKYKITFIRRKTSAHVTTIEGEDNDHE